MDTRDDRYHIVLRSRSRAESRTGLWQCAQSQDRPERQHHRQVQQPWIAANRHRTEYLKRRPGPASRTTVTAGLPKMALTCQEQEQLQLTGISRSHSKLSLSPTCGNALPECTSSDRSSWSVPPPPAKDPDQYRCATSHPIVFVSILHSPLA